MLRIDRALVILSLLTASAYADPPPSERVVLDLTASGTGCPAGGGSVSVTMSPDNTEFTVTYAPFQAQVGLGTQSGDFRKTCSLGVGVHAPPGFTYAIESADYAGFASLAAGAAATLRTSYFFQGQSPTATIVRSLAGPYMDDWRFTNVTDVASLLFGPCGVQRNLNILTDLRVATGTSDPRTTTSFFAVEPPVTYRLAWRRCQ